MDTRLLCVCREFKMVRLDAYLPITLDEFSKRWETAKDAAFAAGWEGGFREEPRVFLVPDECDFLIGFVIKQDNNGTTYVMSPVEMPHLKEYVCMRLANPS